MRSTTALSSQFPRRRMLGLWIVSLQESLPVIAVKLAALIGMYHRFPWASAAIAPSAKR